MGNSYSDIKNTFSSNQRVPKHLQPIKKRRRKKQVPAPRSKDVASPAVAPVQKNPANNLFLINKKLDNVVINDKAPKLFINENDSELAEVVGSGPRGAFRWFKGRRYLNYATKGGLNNNLLPNDQVELDRMRVLSFIIRWGFKGNVIAPVEDQLRSGIEVLNVGFGPGMWTGHDIIDMAMDYRNSHFTAVDACDLLPPDFEETQRQATNDIYNNTNKDKENVKKEMKDFLPAVGDQIATATTVVDNMTLFTPMHPNLSLKLQNTTTPVRDSSLDSNNSSMMLLSRIEEDQQTKSYATTTTISTVNYDQEEEHEFSEEEDGKLSFINGVSPDYNVTPQPPRHRTLLPNLDFYQVNVVDAKLPFEDNTFDFVMQRLVTTSFTVANWKRVIAELVRVTKPGGYIQLLEVDYFTFNLGPEGREWESHLLEIVRLKRQMEPRMAEHLFEVLKAVRLIDVSSKLVTIPLGSWGLDLGNLWKHNVEMFIDSTCPLMSKFIGVSATAYRARWHRMLEEVQDGKPFSNIHAAWGRKPTYPLDLSTIDWSLCSPLS